MGIAPGLLGELDNHDVACLLTYSSTLEDMSKWVVADLLVWAELRAAHHAGQNSGRAFWDARDALWDELLDSCKMDLSKHTCYNMVATAHAFPWQRRRHTETLSFEHHRLLVARDEDEQEYWLDMAEAGGWSVARLRGALYGETEISPHVTVMSAPTLWPRERVERELDTIFTRRSQVEEIRTDVLQLIETIQGDYEHAQDHHSRPPRR